MMTKKIKSNLKRLKAGLSLLEVAVAIIVLSVLMTFVINYYHQYVAQMEERKVADQLQETLLSTKKYLQEAGWAPMIDINPYINRGNLDWNAPSFSQIQNSLQKNRVFPRHNCVNDYMLWREFWNGTFNEGNRFRILLFLENEFGPKKTVTPWNNEIKTLIFIEKPYIHFSQVSKDNVTYHLLTFTHGGNTIPEKSKMNIAKNLGFFGAIPSSQSQNKRITGLNKQWYFDFTDWENTLKTIYASDLYKKLYDINQFPGNDTTESFGCIGGLGKLGTDFDKFKALIMNSDIQNNIYAYTSFNAEMDNTTNISILVTGTENGKEFLITEPGAPTISRKRWEPYVKAYEKDIYTSNDYLQLELPTRASVNGIAVYYKINSPKNSLVIPKSLSGFFAGCRQSNDHKEVRFYLQEHLQFYGNNSTDAGDFFSVPFTIDMVVYPCHRASGRYANALSPHPHDIFNEHTLSHGDDTTGRPPLLIKDNPTRLKRLTNIDDDRNENNLLTGGNPYLGLYSDLKTLNLNQTYYNPLIDDREYGVPIILNVKVMPTNVSIINPNTYDGVPRW